MIELRDYQSSLIHDVRLALRSHRNVLLQSATGSGKTAMASFMLQRVAERNSRGYFICHRRELVDQTAKTFDQIDLPYGYIAAGYPMNLYQPIQICSIDTLKNRVEKVPEPGFTIWDEAHHLGAAGWARVHAAWEKSYHVGLSATPCRLDGKGLDDRFDYLVPGPQVSWLIEQGYLANYKLFSVPVDMSGVHTRMGDYVKAESEAVMDKPSITGDIVAHWQKHALGRRTIGFAVSIKHSKHIVERFQAVGISAAHLDAETDKADRRRILREFATGKIDVVWNVGLFGEGYDLAANSGIPDVVVECVIDGAPTQSLGAWLQRCGRALRPQARDAVILDHSGNAMRHGLPCQERHWTLAGRVVEERGGRSDGEPEVKVRQCEKCYFVFKSGHVCPNCGHVHEVGRVIKEVDGELEEVTEAVRVERRQQAHEQRQARSLDDLKQVAQQQGKDAKWAEHVYQARQEKQQLRTRLYNLTVGLDRADIDCGIAPQDIHNMKPKELKSEIARCEALLKGEAVI